MYCHLALWRLSIKSGLSLIFSIQCTTACTQWKTAMDMFSLAADSPVLQAVWEWVQARRLLRNTV